MPAYAGRGVDAVGADQDVASRFGSVRKAGGHTVRGLHRAREHLAVLYADAPPFGLLIQHPVQVGAIEELHRRHAGRVTELP
jgi:hypothetical protein